MSDPLYSKVWREPEDKTYNLLQDVSPHGTPARRLLHERIRSAIPVLYETVEDQAKEDLFDE